MGVVTDAVILAGGLGTRMLPASLFAPKEMLPLVDTPIINHLIWEAAKSGVSRIHLVLTERKKLLLQDFLDKGTIYKEGIRRDLPKQSLTLGYEGVELITHVQNESLGVGDAISAAIRFVRGPFLVLLGDMLIIDGKNTSDLCGPFSSSERSLELVNEFEKTGLPCIGLCEIERSSLGQYGVVRMGDGFVEEIKEKPEDHEIDSNLIICGRYLFPEDSKKVLEKYKVSDYGEMQSIEFLNHYIRNGGLKGVIFEDALVYDAGNPISWLKSQVDHALRREDYSTDMSDWLRDRMSRI